MQGSKGVKSEETDAESEGLRIDGGERCDRVLGWEKRRNRTEKKRISQRPKNKFEESSGECMYRGRKSDREARACRRGFEVDCGECKKRIRVESRVRMPFAMPSLMNWFTTRRSRRHCRILRWGRCCSLHRRIRRHRIHHRRSRRGFHRSFHLRLHLLHRRSSDGHHD